MRQRTESVALRIEGKALSRSGSERASVLFEEKYRPHAEWHGDERARKDAASARRVATGVVSAASQFKDLLPPQETETLRQAALILRALSKDLDKVAVLSEASLRAREARDLKQRHASADELAAKRWQTDAAMLTEAPDLAAFVDQFEDSGAKSWTLSRHRGCVYAYGPDESMSSGRRLVDLLNPKGNCESVLEVRRRAAEYVLHLQSNARRVTRQYDEMWYVGLDDYEEWRVRHTQIDLAAGDE